MLFLPLAFHALPQLISLDEGRVREALDTIGASYRKGQTARRQLLLEAEPPRRSSSGSGSAASPRGAAAQEARLPLDYRCQVVSRAEAVEAGWEARERQLRRYFPPASTEADSYTVLKFHPLEDSMLHAGGIGTVAAAVAVLFVCDGSQRAT